MKIKFINFEEDKHIAYFPNTRRFFKVNENGKQLISSIMQLKTKESVKQQFNINDLEYDNLFNKIKSYDICECIEPQKSCSQTLNMLGRLVIHLTNDCNLRCKYCYAEGGHYQSPECITDIDTLRKVLDVFYNKFDNINTIQLFGGEPLLNMAGVKYICEEVEKINLERGNKTNIGIVTNGTLINDDFINLVEKYSISVTVSYDGDRDVNNSLRIYPNGSGSSNTVIEKTLKLKEKTGQPNTIEATYTRQHVDNNLSVVDVVNHIKETFGDVGVHLVPVGGEKGKSYTLEKLEPFVDSIDDIYNSNIDSSYSLSQRIVHSLNPKAHISKHICDAGIGTLSVSAKGSVYTCFMFTDNDEMELGNIYDENVFESTKFSEIINKTRKFSNKDENTKCSKCYINSICNGCLGLNSYQSNSPFILDENTCEMYKQMVEKTLINLAYIVNR